MNKINKDTFVSLGVILTLLGATFSFGVMYNKTNNLVEDVAELKLSVREIDAKIDQIKFSQTNLNHERFSLMENPKKERSGLRVSIQSPFRLIPSL